MLRSKLITLLLIIITLSGCTTTRSSYILTNDYYVATSTPHHYLSYTRSHIIPASSYTVAAPYQRPIYRKLTVPSTHIRTPRFSCSFDGICLQ